MYIASQNGDTDVVDLLVQAGADIHLATTECGSVPLGIAAVKGHTETVQRLLELGANVNCQEKTGNTALHFAAENGHSQIVALLLAAGATDTPDQVPATLRLQTSLC
ncbi:Ankyrin repeat domain-containing protein 17 [Geodia barretti]|uniref:Ankyrin repeat domain-containing protein 17 n=1 Tax=Geodia barretti TaxID=519541 RepID=A0AA35S9B8_GEOBA|nr:Ankyrin repeat domain-containing protein 17 [Geodia barretti]